MDQATVETIGFTLIVLAGFAYAAWLSWLNRAAWQEPSAQEPPVRANPIPRATTRTHEWSTSSTTVSVTGRGSTTLAIEEDGTLKVSVTTPSGTKTTTITVGADGVPKVTTVDTPAEAKPAETPVPPKAEP